MSDPNALTSGLSGRDFYAEKFRTEFDREAEWLRRTAKPKADSIAHLLRSAGLAPESVVEVGAGTGAVLIELRRRGVGTEHFAVDFSGEAIAEVRRLDPGVHVAVADVTDEPDPFGRGPYDLVYASHVVEHLEEPEAFLSALRGVPAAHLVAEVPLENLPLGRLKALLVDRTNHAAGHVQFFDRASFEALVRRAGWRIVGSHTYAPQIDVDTFAFAYGESGPVRRGAKWLTERVLPRGLGSAWTTFYHAHHAVLCERADGEEQSSAR